MIVEHAPFGRRGFFASFTLQGVQVGQILAAAIFLPLAHDPALAASLRADGWQTVAALTASEDAQRLGCGFVLGPDGPVEA